MRERSCLNSFALLAFARYGHFIQLLWGEISRNCVISVQSIKRSREKILRQRGCLFVLKFGKRMI